MKKTSAVVGFLLAYLLFTLATVPARFALQWVELPNTVQLGTISGTIWHSKINAVQLEQTLIQRVDIKLSALSLLTLNPSISVSFGDPLLSGPEGQAEISKLLSNPEISDARVLISANELASQLPLPIAITAHSNIAVEVANYIKGDGLCQQLAGTVRWQNSAVTALDEKVNLGPLNARLDCQQGNVVMVLDEANDLGLSFQLMIAAGGQVSGQGLLTPSEQMPEAIRQLTPFLGRPDNQGRYRLRF